MKPTPATTTPNAGPSARDPVVRKTSAARHRTAGASAATSATVDVKWRSTPARDRHGPAVYIAFATDGRRTFPGAPAADGGRRLRLPGRTVDVPSTGATAELGLVPPSATFTGKSGRDPPPSKRSIVTLDIRHVRLITACGSLPIPAARRASIARSLSSSTARASERVVNEVGLDRRGGDIERHHPGPPTTGWTRRKPQEAGTPARPLLTLVDRRSRPSTRRPAGDQPPTTRTSSAATRSARRPPARWTATTVKALQVDRNLPPGLIVRTPQPTSPSHPGPTWPVPTRTRLDLLLPRSKSTASAARSCRRRPSETARGAALGDRHVPVRPRRRADVDPPSTCPALTELASPAAPLRLP